MHEIEIDKWFLWLNIDNNKLLHFTKAFLSTFIKKWKKIVIVASSMPECDVSVEVTFQLWVVVGSTWPVVTMRILWIIHIQGKKRLAVGSSLYQPHCDEFVCMMTIWLGSVVNYLQYSSVNALNRAFGSQASSFYLIQKTNVNKSIRYRINFAPPTRHTYVIIMNYYRRIESHPRCAYGHWVLSNKPIELIA